MNDKTTPDSLADDSQRQATDTSSAKATESLLRVPTDTEEAEAYGQDEHATHPPSRSARIWPFFHFRSQRMQGNRERTPENRRPRIRRVIVIAVLSLLIAISISLAVFLNYRRHHMLSSEYKKKAQEALDATERLREDLTSEDAPGYLIQMTKMEANQAVHKAQFSISTAPDRFFQFQLARLNMLLSFYSTRKLMQQFSNPEDPSYPRLQEGVQELKDNLNRLGSKGNELAAFEVCDRAARYFLETGQVSPDDESACVDKSGVAYGSDDKSPGH